MSGCLSASILPEVKLTCDITDFFETFSAFNGILLSKSRYPSFNLISFLKVN